jgi:hypothetical protein
MLQKKQTFLGYFFHGKGYVLIYTKNALGINLGDFSQANLVALAGSNLKFRAQLGPNVVAKKWHKFFVSSRRASIVLKPRKFTFCFPGCL